MSTPIIPLLVLNTSERQVLDYTVTHGGLTLEGGCPVGGTLNPSDAAALSLSGFGYLSVESEEYGNRQLRRRAYRPTEAGIEIAQQMKGAGL